MKRALVLNAVDPRIGGVLIRGERGTAKSTAARAMAALLPKIEVFTGSPFNDDPRSPSSWSPRCSLRLNDPRSVIAILKTCSMVSKIMPGASPLWV